MFFNGNASMITSASNIMFMTVDHILSQKDDHLSRSLNKAIKLLSIAITLMLVIRCLIDYGKSVSLLPFYLLMTYVLCQRFSCT